MLTVADRIQIPSKTTHKDTGTKENASYYLLLFIQNTSPILIG